MDESQERDALFRQEAALSRSAAIHITAIILLLIAALFTSVASGNFWTLLIYWLVARYHLTPAIDSLITETKRQTSELRHRRESLGNPTLQHTNESP